MTGQGAIMFAEQFTLTAKSRATLNVFHQPSAVTPKGVICINHGLAEHAARYARFAEALSGAAGMPKHVIRNCRCTCLVIRWEV